MSERYGWVGDFTTLIAAEPNALARGLAERIDARGSEQFAAWSSSLGILRDAATECVQAIPAAAEFATVLEYQLPRDDRRPDVIVLENGTVLVIEFKEGARATLAAIDQVRDYARDLRHYHSESHARRVVPILVPVAYGGNVHEQNGVLVVPPQRLAREVVRIAAGALHHRPDADRWVRGSYDPLPGLAHAARALFERRPLPRIKRADAANIPAVVEWLTTLAKRAHAERSRHLVLLTGSPGSGKTLVGLQLVHHRSLEALTDDRGGAAVFLSGNDPLVEVLRRALGGADFVHSLKLYLDDYADHADATPREHVIVFDEAQRAWDAKRVLTKHKGKLGGVSEPELILRIADRVPEWCVVLALVGEGQEIHVGEEGGLALWTSALASRPSWQLHAPPRVAVSGARPEPLLDLTTSLRSHTAGNLHRWVACVLDGKLDDAAALVPSLDGYALYVTSDVEAARAHVRERYHGRADSRYGLLASSCAENLRGIAPRLKEDGINGKYATWYEGDAGAKHHCRTLRTAVSEFGCQGLELDFAIVCWGDDLSWTGTEWKQLRGKKKAGAKDRARLRLNAYRVLLTRGRDGMCIVVPEGNGAVLEALQAAGCQVLAE